MRTTLFGRAEFDDFSEIHHHDALADVFDYGEVVRDEQVGDAALFLQVLEQVDDLGLDADIQSADGFVANDEFGFDGERARDADALTLAAAEFVRVTLRVFGSRPTEVSSSSMRLGGRRFARVDECPRLRRLSRSTVMRGSSELYGS